MNPIMTRARELLPAILITVLSMIQALALELYWSKIGDSSYLWLGGWNAAIGWLQLAIVFLGIVLIWLLYVSSVLRFSWVPAMERYPLYSIPAVPPTTHSCGIICHIPEHFGFSQWTHGSNLPAPNGV